MRFVQASVIRVAGCEGFDADIDLGFGVHVHRLVRMRRRDLPYEYAGHGQEANHCLVCLVGGKPVLLVDAREDGKWVTADVFLTAPTAQFPQVALPGLPGKYVDVYAAMLWAAAQGWDARLVREALKP